MDMDGYVSRARDYLDFSSHSEMEAGIVEELQSHFKIQNSKAKFRVHNIRIPSQK